MYKIRDCTSGFRAINSTLLKKIDLSTIKVHGYAFRVALLHKALIHRATIKEIPVDFIDRTKGQSKLGLPDIIEFILNVGWIRFQNSKTFVKFGLVGGSGVIVNLAFFTLFPGNGMNKYLASPIAIELSIIWNFLLNNYWTFRWRKTRTRTQSKGLKFNVISFFVLGVSYLTFVLLMLSFPNIQPQVHQVIAIIPASLINYFLNSYWTFRECSDASET